MTYRLASPGTKTLAKIGASSMLSFVLGVAPVSALTLLASGCSSGQGLLDNVFGTPDGSAGDDMGGGSGNDDGGMNPNPGSAGALHTQGAQIRDKNGNVVRLTGVSWFGMETDWFAPHGLDKQSLSWHLDKMKALKFNSIRIPFCTQMLDDGKMPNQIIYDKNPELRGKKPIEILDTIVSEAGKRGLRIILDRHRPDAYSQAELWYTGQYSEQRFIDDWKMLAQRYRGNSTVIGFDLHNEPRGQATWGSGNMQTDWRLAAERAGNAVLAVNPDLLIIVEGIESVNNSYYWWGGNLMSAGQYPVRLNVADRVVYSTHDYPESVYGQSWFSDGNYPNNLPAVWDKYWGYLVKQNIAPVWIGEFGTKYQSDKDKKWLAALASYAKSNGVSFAFWCWNPNSDDTGGILASDWTTVNQDKMSVIDPALAPAF